MCVVCKVVAYFCFGLISMMLMYIVMFVFYMVFYSLPYCYLF